MRKTDGRKLGRATLEEIRIRAVRRVEAGESPETVIRALGFTRPRIYEWIGSPYMFVGVMRGRDALVTG